MGAYRFAYDGPTMRGGPGAIDSLEAELAELGCERAIIVCGRNVGDNDALMERVREGIGDHLAGVFAETTPEKRLGTAIRGRAFGDGRDADAIIGLGGGSSLDVATLIGALAGVERPATTGAELQEHGTFAIPDGDLPPIITIPTTLAGADMSMGAGVTAHPETCPVDQPVSAGISDPRLMPAITIHDPDVFATTPPTVLAGSAMNGFDKGIETLYSRKATPITDATATEGLRRLRPGLRSLYEQTEEGGDLARMLEGLVLVQYGISRTDGRTASLIHAFGHGVSRGYDVQQGVAHGILAPHVLAYLFDHVDARRQRLARALDVPRGTDPARGVVDEVVAVRDALALPRRLRDVDGPEPDAFPAVADAVASDNFMANRPPGLDPTEDDLVGILEAAY